MSLALRDYQVQAITAIKAREEPGACVPIVLATGLGKTVIFTSYVTDWLDRNAGQRALIIVHTDELAEQALAKMRQVAPHRRAGMVKAGRNDVHAEIIVSSRQTLGSARRREQLKRVGLIVIDECHHAVRTNGYGKILDFFGVFDEPMDSGRVYASDLGLHPAPFVLGVTATLARGDKAKLSTVWSEPAFTRDILYGIRHGYLLDVRGERVIVPDLDLSRVRVRAGEYNENDIADELERTFAPEVIAQKYVELAGGRRGISFWPLVDTAYHGEKAFLAVGIRSGTVHGSLPKPERRELLQRFRLPLEHSEAIDVMHNAMVLCLDEKTEILTDEGWVGPDAMTLEHRVANWDQGKVHFVEPREVVVRPRGPEESMYFLETPRRSIRVTGRHRMLYRTSRTGPYLKAPVDDIAGRVVKLPTTGFAEPIARADITLDEARLIGFWVGDGTASRPKSGGVSYVLTQSTRYTKIIEWVDGVLERVGVDALRADKSHYTVPHIRWALPRGTGGKSQARRGVKHLEPWLVKDGSSLLWSLDRDQFNAFLEGLWYADGNHGLAEGGFPGSGYFKIYAKRMALLGLLQAIGAVRGWTGAIRLESAPRSPKHAQVYRLSMTSKTQHAMHPGATIQLEREPWREERVWCVRTETKNIITRRRGSVTVMGNTEGFDEPTADVVVIARPSKNAALIQQMVGRVLRPDLTKPPADRGQALILDVTGAGAHSNAMRALVDLSPERAARADEDTGLSLSEWDEYLDEVEEELEEQRAGGSFEFESPAYVGPAATETFDPLGRDKVWGKTPAGHYYINTGNGYVFLAPSLAGGAEPGTVDVVTCAAERGQWVKGTEHTALSLELALGWGEDVAIELGGHGSATLTGRKSRWRNAEPSEAQKRFATNLRIDITGMNKGELSEALDSVQAARRIDPLVAMVQARVDSTSS